MVRDRPSQLSDEVIFSRTTSTVSDPLFCPPLILAPYLLIRSSMDPILVWLTEIISRTPLTSNGPVLLLPLPRSTWLFRQAPLPLTAWIYPPNTSWTTIWLR